MDCELLRADIKKLTSNHASLLARLKKINNTGGGSRIDIMEAMKEAGGLEDEILEKYLEEFKRKNPEIFSLKLEDKPTPEHLKINPYPELDSFL